MKPASKTRTKKAVVRKRSAPTRTAVKNKRTATRTAVVKPSQKTARPVRRDAETPKQTHRLLWMLVALLVVVNLGLAGWRLTHRHPQAAQTANDANSVTFIPYTDTANRFTLNYPDTWQLAYAPRGGSDGPVQAEPDWSKTSRPLVITPATGQKNNAVTVTPGCTAATITDAKARKDKFHTLEDLHINGYTALYDKLDFQGDAEQYLNHTYIVLGAHDCLQLSYRESWRHPMSNTDFDDSGNMPDFKAIVNSVKFLQ